MIGHRALSYFAWIATVCTASAAQLSVHTWTTADGLPSNRIHCIREDSRGLLWFGTSAGLSLFDGFSFTNFGVQDGLPGKRVLDFRETPEGDYWMATSAGIARWRAGKGRITPAAGLEHFSDSVLPDGPQRVWAGTRTGLFLIDPIQGHLAAPGPQIPVGVWGDRKITVLLKSRTGAVIAGTDTGFYVYRTAGIDHYTQADGLPGDSVPSLVETADGVLWAGSYYGVARLLPVHDGKYRVERVFHVQDGLAGNSITCLFETSRGALWAGSTTGLSRWIPASGRFESFAIAQGLSDDNIQSLGEDRAGNLWIGTESGGVMKLPAAGFTGYGPPDGLEGTEVVSLAAGHQGDPVAITRSQRGLFINRYQKGRFQAVRPVFPSEVTNFGWGSGQFGLRTAAGSWLLPTGAGLYRFSAALNRPVLLSDPHLATNNIFRTFEDHAGTVWVSVVSGIQNQLLAAPRGSLVFRGFTEADGLPSARSKVVTAFSEDRAGQLWIGFNRGGVARFRDGRFMPFDEGGEAPPGSVRDLHLDSRGWMWVSTDGGLAVVTNAARFRRIAEFDSVAGGEYSCIAEDAAGRMYVGAARGVLRFVPGPSGSPQGEVRRFTVADGAPRGTCQAALRDGGGDLWFGGTLGLARLTPTEGPPGRPPRLLLRSVRAGSTVVPLAAAGESSAHGFTLGPGEGNLDVEFAAVGLAPGGVVFYRFRLGSDAAWSVPSPLRNLHFAGLPPGEQAIEIQAVEGNSAPLSGPVTLEFRVVAPFWRRWWFILLAAALMGSALWFLYDARVSSLLEVERIRLRIASDLHDDIASGLSHIAILSELGARREVLAAPRGAIQDSGPAANTELTRIAEASRDMVDSIGDIVWSVSPRRDRWSDLAQRVRRFGSDVLTSRQIAVSFDFPEHASDLSVATDTRRQVYLIFKEAIHNIARHSGATEVAIGLRQRGGDLILSVRDNGCGFQMESSETGHGLAGMRARARSVGGTFLLQSSPGGGTLLELRVPRKRSRRFGFLPV